MEFVIVFSIIFVVIFIVIIGLVVYIFFGFLFVELGDFFDDYED